MKCGEVLGQSIVVLIYEMPMKTPIILGDQIFMVGIVPQQLHAMMYAADILAVDSGRTSLGRVLDGEMLEEGNRLVLYRARTPDACSINDPLRTKSHCDTYLPKLSRWVLGVSDIVVCVQ